MNPDAPRHLTRSDLHEAAKLVGLTGFDHRGILNKEKRKLLLCPRRPASNWRVFNENDINEIIKSFMPGGRGCWYFNAVDDTKE